MSVSGINNDFEAESLSEMNATMSEDIFVLDEDSHETRLLVFGKLIIDVQISDGFLEEFKVFFRRFSGFGRA